MRTPALAIVIALTGGTALAQPAPPPVEKTEAEKKAEAKALYEKGNNHYNLGEFDEAIAAFKAAYALTSAPGLLFNLAQAYRLKKDYDQASYFYKTYLRLKPDAANKVDVEARIAEMDKFIEEQKASAKLPPTGVIDPDKPGSDKPVGPVEKPEPLPKMEEEPKDVVTPGNGKPMKLAGIVTGGAGVLLVATGVVFGMMASSAESDLNALNGAMGTWTSEQQDKYDAGKRNNTIAIIGLAAGGAAIATGAVLYYLGYKKEHPAERTVAVVPNATGATVAVGWSF